MSDTKAIAEELLREAKDATPGEREVVEVDEGKEHRASNELQAVRDVLTDPRLGFRIDGESEVGKCYRCGGPVTEFWCSRRGFIFRFKATWMVCPDCVRGDVETHLRRTK